MGRNYFLAFSIFLIILLNGVLAAEGDYISSFSAPEVYNLQDIAFGDNYFWLADGDCWDGCGIYQYTFSDKKYTGFYFDLSATENWGASGMAYDGFSFWILDNQDKLIYQYLDDWTPTGFNIHVGDIESPIGITTDGTYFWISSGQIMPLKIQDIYKYWMNGTYTGESFRTSTYSPNSKDIVNVGNYIWVLGGTSVYKYLLDGNYTGFSFDISGSGIITPSGITSDGDSLWISDSTTGRVYQFELSVCSEEVCDGIDNDCDGQIDEDLPLFTFYRDMDGDNYGNPSISIESCFEFVSGYTKDNTDCDDSSKKVNPIATEICNEIDDNCNSEIDEGEVCDPLPVLEVCDGIDNDGDSLIDEGFPTYIYYLDEDGDGEGNPLIFVETCYNPVGYTNNNYDCDDTNTAVNTKAIEICNEIDDNCDEQVDEGVQTLFYSDYDDDGFGGVSGESYWACTAPEGFVIDNTDCNDSDELIYPGAEEVCDNVDNDCSGFIDEDLTRLYGTTDVGECEYGIEICSFGVWDISVPSVESVSEICDGLDNNCDGEIDENVKTMFYPDFDEDGFGDFSYVEQACTAPEGFILDNGDCDDSSDQINPNSEEICDGLDNNCDGFVDEGFLDTDGDHIADCVDLDDDNDNVPDSLDSCPLVSTLGYDVDFNGCRDNLYDFHSIVSNLPSEVISQDYRVVLLADISNSIKSFEKEKYSLVIKDMTSLADSLMEQKVRKIKPETANILSNYAKNVAATVYVV